jgi:glutaredoxin
MHIAFVAMLALSAPDVTVYGASWCGPCQMVKNYLTQQHVAFDFIDIDQDGNRERFAKVSPDSGAIPLTFVGKESVRGARLPAIKTLLVQRAMLQGPQSNAAGEYGGYSAAEWQQQFQAMRQRVATLKTRLAQLEKDVVDVEGRQQILPRARRDLKVATDSLDALEKAASDVSLPRQYRAY